MILFWFNLTNIFWALSLPKKNITVLDNSLFFMFKIVSEWLITSESLTIWLDSGMWLGVLLGGNNWWIFCSSPLQIVSVGYAKFGSTKGDHRLLWIDISKVTSIGSQLPMSSTRTTKQLCNDPWIVKQYNNVLKEELQCHAMYHRAHRLLESFHEPLTQKEEKEYKKLDKIREKVREKAMKKVKEKCRKLWVGKYQWSPQYDVGLYYMSNSKKQEKNMTNIWKQKKLVSI